MQTLGTLSYSWCLWHWPFLKLGTIALPDLAVPVRTFVLVIASFMLAWVAFRLVENPIRRHPAMVRRNRQSLPLGAVLICAGAIAGPFSYGIAKQALTEPIPMAIATARNDIPNRRCIASFADTSLRSCVHGKDRSSTVIVLFGDSHAHQWLPALKQVAENSVGGWLR